MKLGCVAAAIVLGLAAFAGDAGSAPAELCVVVDPLLELGCRAAQTSAPAPSSSAAAPVAAERVRHSSTETRYDPRRLAITFKHGTSLATIRATIAKAGTTLEEAIPQIDGYLVGVEPARRAEALASLRSSPAVAGASQELLAQALDTNPDDSDWPEQDGLRVVGFPKAWDVTQGSSRVVIAVVDTGVDARHPDLRGAVVPGYDFVNSDSDPTDDEGHGTAVAGVIAARSNNHEGGAGICWHCVVMAVKVLDSRGIGDDTVIAAGIVWAVDHGARVINLSLGGPGASQELSNAIAYASARGALVVAAAGNSGTTTQFFPAADPRAISVAATTVADRRYSWSNFGSWVRVAAPGCNVAPVLGGAYGTFCGTSSATPLVTGLIALELSIDPAATPQDVQDALAHAAVPLPDFVQFGRIDAARTLSLLRPARRTTAVFRGSISSRARVHSYRLEAGTGALSATLRFTGGRTLGLAVVPAEGGAAVAQAAGRSPLRLQTSTSDGTYVLRVSGGARTKFVLSVSYVLRTRPA